MAGLCSVPDLQRLSVDNIAASTITKIWGRATIFRHSLRVSEAPGSFNPSVDLALESLVKPARLQVVAADLDDIVAALNSDV
jgi:hypothetical protein